ncbi:MAG: ABC transporter ATP-binding protein [Parachlamydiales bacterium]|jgi:putative ABC transport system ATP-binding protein
MSQPADLPLVDIRKLSKFYRMGDTTVEALKEVDLTIRKGESVAIMGPSGSGKSTLMHLLGCLDKPSQGEYYLEGQNIADLDDTSLSSLRASSIGFVFQSFNLIHQLNVYENVEVPFLYQKQKRANSHQRILESIDRVGLSKRLHHVPKELSGGEMQRVAIARALAIDPLMIFADEPTGNLDSATGENILQLFQELNSQGVTILMVTHDKTVGNHCKRLVQMKDGRIISDSAQVI